MKTLGLLYRTLRRSPKFVQNLQKFTVQCFHRVLHTRCNRLGVAGTCLDKGEWKIILCSDSRLGTDASGGEVAFKADQLCEGFVGLVAGMFPHCLELVKFLRMRLGGDRFRDTLPLITAIREGLHAFRRLWVEDHIQRKLSVPYESFLNIGKEKLPDTFFGATVDEIDNLRFGCDLIAAGFIEGNPLLLKIDEECGISEEDPFTSIGSGAESAETMLYFRSYKSRLSLQEALYYHYEAKRMAEVSPDVGKETHMIVLGSKGQMVKSQVVTLEGILKLQQQFCQFGPQPFRVAMQEGSEDPQSPKRAQKPRRPMRAVKQRVK